MMVNFDAAHGVFGTALTTCERRKNKYKGARPNKQ
jgi:hypothetical protein